ncbi:MAG: FtsX-like permease family protein, partial [DPANN group archaeon]|nr:FtsX-like permease family protein [DPANN group archaeon]
SGGASTAKLTDHDVSLITKVQGVDKAFGMIYASARASFDDQTKTVSVIGMPTDTESSWFIKKFNVQGRYPQSTDRYDAVIGSDYPNGLVFTKDLKLGNKFKIEGQTFRVVGVLQEIGNRQDDSQIYIPISIAQSVFNMSDNYGMVYVKIKTGANVTTVAENIKKSLRKDRGEKIGEEDFMVQTSEQLASAIGSILGIISAILIGIASIALLVGSVGIMNTMYTSVLERTREIGIMKAVGAKNSDVMLIFLVESGFLGLIGGIIGVLLGVGMAMAAQTYAAFAGYPLLKAYITPELIAAGLLFSFTMGAIAGFLPARQASKMKPADALRYE